MSYELKMYFDLKKDPFSSNLGVKELMELEALGRVKKRIDYLLNISGIMVITGDVGAGKSTSLRWAINQYHPSEHHIISIIATSGSANELYRQISWELGLNLPNSRIATMQKEIRSTIEDIATVKRQKVLIVIDEANLLRTDLLSELHTLSQYDYDSKPHLSIILCGQSSLLDKLCQRSCEPLASRVIGRLHLVPLDEAKTREYVKHHLNVAGSKKDLFNDAAHTAIYQGSAGILRRINQLARGAMLAASLNQQRLIEAEHVRIAASELL